MKKQKFKTIQLDKKIFFCNKYFNWRYKLKDPGFWTEILSEKIKRNMTSCAQFILRDATEKFLSSGLDITVFHVCRGNTFQFMIKSKPFY